MKKTQGTVFDRRVGAIPNVSVTVYNQGLGTKPTIYSDNGVTEQSNPFQTDSLGRWAFYVANGRYDIEFSGTMINTYKLEDLLIEEGSSGAEYALLAGRSGGQTLYGGIGANENLNLKSTSDTTKGKIFLGDFLYYNEADDMIGRMLGEVEHQVMLLNTVATAVGLDALLVNTGEFNSAFGIGALQINTTGKWNTAVGFYALNANIEGYGNVAVGLDALGLNTGGTSQGSYCTAIGMQALGANTLGYENTAIGMNSLWTNTIGSYNTALGNASMNANISGNSNVALGLDAIFYSEIGSENTVVGHEAGYGVIGQSYSYNSILGYRAGYSLTTGYKNTLLGYKAGDNITSGHDNIIIGADVDAPAVNSVGRINIGGVIYGDSVLGNVGIGTPNPDAMLTIYSETRSDQIKLGAEATDYYRIGRNIGDGYLEFYGNQVTYSGFRFITVDSGNVFAITDAGMVGIGTDIPKTKLHVVGLPVYANNAAAVAGGLTAGAFYRTNADPDLVCVVH